MDDKIIDFVRRTAQQQRRGYYLRLMESHYEKSILTEPVATIIWQTLRKDNRRTRLETAFNEYDPLHDEILISIGDREVLTNRRFFLFGEHGELERPPIDLAGIESYKPAGARSPQRIVMNDGEMIRRHVPSGVDGTVVRKLMAEVAGDAEPKDLHLLTPRLFDWDSDLERASQDPLDGEADEELRQLATSVAGECGLESYALCRWETTAGAVENVLSLWAKRAVFGVAGDMLHSNQRLFGLAVLTSDGKLRVCGLGAMGAESSIGADDVINGTPDLTAVFSVDVVDTVATRTGNTVEAGEIEFEFPASFLLENPKFPRKILDLRFDTEEQNPVPEPTFAELESKEKKNTLVGCGLLLLIAFALFLFIANA